MPIVYQKRVYREDLSNNPDVLYLFGDNNYRSGFGGQASEMRGEPNAIGVRTKMKPSRMADAFMSDDKLDQNKLMIDEDLKPAFDHVQFGGVVVIPSDGLGTGLSEMPTRCPLTFEYLEAKLSFLKTMAEPERYSDE